MLVKIASILLVLEHAVTDNADIIFPYSAYLVRAQPCVPCYANFANLVRLLTPEFSFIHLLACSPTLMDRGLSLYRTATRG